MFSAFFEISVSRPAAGYKRLLMIVAELPSCDAYTRGGTLKFA